MIKKMGKIMNYNKIIIALVIILVAVAVAGFIMLNQTGNSKINNATNVTNKTNTTNTTNVTANTTPKISTDEVHTEKESSSKRSYADMAHDSDAHSNPEKAKELNDNIVGGKDGIYYFSDGSSVDMR